jgi:alpha-mannosidase
LRTFKIQISPPSTKLTPPVTEPLTLPYNLNAISFHANLTDGAFDEDGRTYAAEALPSHIVSEGIDFTMGPTADGLKNTVACDGQEISLPAGFDRAYLLASAADGDQQGDFVIGGRPINLTVQNWDGYIGQWDNRLWRGKVPVLTYDWHNPFAGLTPGYIKRDTVAWFCSHGHHPEKGNEYYRYNYLFKYALDLPQGVTSLVLSHNAKIRVFAITVARNLHDNVRAANPLYDTLDDHAVKTAPTISPAGGKLHDATSITINHPLYWREGGLHYTIDGSEPTADSSMYTGPFTVMSSLTLRVREFDEAGRGGPEASADFEMIDTHTLPSR